MRETILDGRIHLEDGLNLAIPPAPPLCGEEGIDPLIVETGGCRLYCELEGKGLPLVLLHGGPGGTHHCFHPFFSRFKRQARVVYYDQRGCGRSDYLPAGGYTVSQAVEDLEGVRRSLGLGPLLLVGHSYGGLLAQCYALRHPDTVAGMVLVCASPGAGIAAETKDPRQSGFLSDPEYRKILAIHADGSLSTGQAVYNALLNGDWKRQYFYRPAPERMARQALYECTRDPAVCAIEEKIELRGAFEDCPIPTLLIEGAWDRTWEAGKARLLGGNHPKAELVMFEHSSHSPFEDEPERFEQVLGEFLRRLPLVPSRGLNRWKDSLARRKLEIAARLAKSSFQNEESHREGQV